MTKSTTIQLKILIHETLQAQVEFTKFLRMMAQRYGRLLNEEDAHQGAILMQRATETIDRLTNTIDYATITLSDEKYHNDSSDGEVPEPFCLALVTSRLMREKRVWFLWLLTIGSSMRNYSVSC